MLLAANGFKISSMMMASARMRYRYRQELRLIEGLLAYGIHLCNENKKVLMLWGAHKSQTMYLSFDPWPAGSVVNILGKYSGFLSITSQEGSLYLDTTMTKNNSTIMTGQCIMRMSDPKDFQSALVVSNWLTKVGS
jgi:hypothetical protein